MSAAGTSQTKMEKEATIAGTDQTVVGEKITAGTQQNLTQSRRAEVAG